LRQRVARGDPLPWSSPTKSPGQQATRGTVHAQEGCDRCDHGKGVDTAGDLFYALGWAFSGAVGFSGVLGGGDENAGVLGVPLTGHPFFWFEVC
jgi:hypothetical protein